MELRSRYRLGANSIFGPQQFPGCYSAAHYGMRIYFWGKSMEPLVSAVAIVGLFAGVFAQQSQRRIDASLEGKVLRQAASPMWLLLLLLATVAWLSLLIIPFFAMHWLFALAAIVPSAFVAAILFAPFAFGRYPEFLAVVERVGQIVSVVCALAVAWLTFGIDRSGKRIADRIAADYGVAVLIGLGLAVAALAIIGNRNMRSILKAREDRH